MKCSHPSFYFVSVTEFFEEKNTDMEFLKHSRIVAVYYIIMKIVMYYDTQKTNK